MQKGQLTPGGNFKLEKQITSLDEFWEIINTKKSFFARHRMYPTAFFHNWSIRMIDQWVKNGWFWTAESNKCCGICDGINDFCINSPSTTMELNSLKNNKRHENFKTYIEKKVV